MCRVSELIIFFEEIKCVEGQNFVRIVSNILYVSKNSIYCLNVVFGLASTTSSSASICEVRLLQCVAVRCSVVHCVAVWCSVLWRGAVCCSVLQCGAVCCSLVQCVAVWCSALQYVAVSCSVL